MKYLLPIVFSAAIILYLAWQVSTNGPSRPGRFGVISGSLSGLVTVSLGS